MMRDYWYNLKDLPAMDRFRKEDDETRLNQGKDKHSDESWSDKINTLITKHIEKMAFSNPLIYEQIGLESDILKEGEAPVIVLFEKKKSEALSIVEAFKAGYVFNRGQMPTFEVANMCAYLERCKYSKGYIFVVADYDPAGMSLFTSIRDKVALFTTDTDIEVIQVKYGDNPTEEFNAYSLTNNKLNRKWIEAGKTKGVEFNSPENIKKGILSYLTLAMQEHIDPRIYVYLSYQRWFSNELYRRAMRDDYYNKLKDKRAKLVKELDRKITWRESRLQELVINTPARFTQHKEDVLSYQTIKAEDKLNSDEDCRYFNSLLGKLNPHSEEYRLKKLGDLKYYRESSL